MAIQGLDCEGQDKHWTVSGGGGGGGAGEGIGGRRVAIQGLDCEGQDKYWTVSGGGGGGVPAKVLGDEGWPSRDWTVRGRTSIGQ